MNDERHCPVCGAPVEADAQRCPACDTNLNTDASLITDDGSEQAWPRADLDQPRLPVLVCPACGTHNPGDRLYCWRCLTGLEAASELELAPAPETVGPVGLAASAGAQPLADEPEPVAEEPLADETVADEPEPVADEPVAEEPEPVAAPDAAPAPVPPPPTGREAADEQASDVVPTAIPSMPPLATPVADTRRTATAATAEQSGAGPNRRLAFWAVIAVGLVGLAGTALRDPVRTTSRR